MQHASRLELLLRHVAQAELQASATTVPEELIAVVLHSLAEVLWIPGLVLAPLAAAARKWAMIRARFRSPQGHGDVDECLRERIVGLELLGLVDELDPDIQPMKWQAQ